MVRIKKISAFLTISIILILSSCQSTLSNDNAPKETIQSEKSVAVDQNELIDTSIDLKLIKFMAKSYIELNAQNYGWEDAEICDSYPLYNPATDKITYMEYKIMKDGKPKGYLMLSLKDDEPRFVESSELSEYTNFEALAEKAGTTNIRAYRFSFASFTAEAKEKSRSGERVILAALGNIENELNLEASSRSGDMTQSNEVYSSWISSYTKRVESNAGLLDVRKDYYDENKDRILEKNASLVTGNTRGGGSTTPVNTDMPSISEQISMYGSNFLMYATQYTLINQYNFTVWSGCAPTAGAVVLAYYERKLGKSNLWPNGAPPDVVFPYSSSFQISNLQNVVGDLRARIGMVDGSATVTNLIKAISSYSVAKGHGAIFYQEHKADSWDTSGLVTIVNHLGQNWPVILGYEESSKIGHATVIFKATIQRDWAGNYKEGTYYVVTGWSSPTEKIINTWDYSIYSIGALRY